MAKKKIKMLNEELDLKLFISIAQKSFFWIFLFMLIATTGSFVKLRYTAPIYESGTLIQIGIVDNANKVLNLGGGMGVNSNSNSYLMGEIEFMRSPTFIEKILETTPLNISYFAKGTVLINELYKQSPFTVITDKLDSTMLDYSYFIKFENSQEYSLIYGNEPTKTLSN